MTPPNPCPVCGAAVPASALACPECGADHETGWNGDKTVYDGLDLPDGEFDYDDFVNREFGDPRKTGRGRMWAWLVALVLAGLVLFILLT
ncbi:MAG: zinc ribbon domain-containing protein [Lentisphaerae bacterium]|nr:zinc ribbon domain-containing protein [Lentisphaerota bacterium]